MPADDLPPAARDTFLVVLDDVLVARDLAQTAAEFSPACDVVVTTTSALALVALADVVNLNAAFLGMEPDAFDGSALQAAIATRGGRVFLLGEEAERLGRGEGWEALVRPFTSDAVKTALLLRER